MANTNNLTAALDYASIGWPVFPCRADKKPYTLHGVHDAATDKKQIEEWWTRYPNANIGMDVGGAGMVVLDFDPGSDIDGIVPTLPATALMQHTPRGGIHLFYTLAPGERVGASASKFAPNVDVRSSSSYVLLPPSRTKDGPYAWGVDAKNGRATAAHRSDYILESCNASRDRHEDSDKWLIEADLPDNVALAVAWLRGSAKVATQGEGGDSCAFSTAAMMKSYGISQVLAFDLLWDNWNSRCSPPWDAEELEIKIENAYKYNTSPPGNITPAFNAASLASLFTPVEAKVEKGREINAKPYRFVDWDRQSEIQPPKWLINNFLAEQSYAIMYGSFGTFKTFLALDISLAIACHGFTTVPTPTRFGADIGGGAVLFSVSEGRSGIVKRTSAWSRTYLDGRAVTDFILADPVPVVRNDNLDAFINGALQMRPGGYKLVVIDTIGRAMQGANENSQEDASQFTAVVQRIQNELGAAVLALHHVGKGTSTAVKGSMEFSAAADTLIHVERRGEMSVSMTMTKQKDFEQWSEARDLVLRKVDLGSETSLVVESSFSTLSVDQRSDDKSPFIMGQLDTAHETVLASNPTRAWNSAELLRMIASSGEFDTKYIRKHMLMARLRETAGTIANRCYDAATNRYMWRAK